jgi:hypothetical protein
LDGQKNILLNLVEVKRMLSIISEISRLCNKYGEDFNWGIVPDDNGFVKELEKETDISQYSDVKAIARSYSCDDVLFMLDNNIYRIYHLTYSTYNENGFPRFMEFIDTNKVIAYIENQFIEEYL